MENYFSRLWGTGISDTIFHVVMFQKFCFGNVFLRFLVKCPLRDACLCMGELPAPPALPAPHFVFLITL